MSVKLYDCKGVELSTTGLVDVKGRPVSTFYDYQGQTLDVGGGGGTIDPLSQDISLSTMFSATYPTHGCQGSLVYGGYMFVGCSDGYMAIYKLNSAMTSATLLTYVTTLAGSGSHGWHHNSLNWGVKYAAGDEFPLLWTTEHYDDSRYAALRITRTNDTTWTFTPVQIITPTHSAAKMLYMRDFVIDSDGGYLWMVGYTQESYTGANNNGNVFVKYRMPALSAGNVTLTDSDELDRITGLSLVETRQQLMYKSGHIYLSCGARNVGTQVSETGAKGVLGVYDLDLSTKSYVSKIDMSRETMNIINEVESIMEIDGVLYIFGVSPANSYVRLLKMYK